MLLLPFIFCIWLWCCNFLFLFFFLLVNTVALTQTYLFLSFKILNAQYFTPIKPNHKNSLEQLFKFFPYRYNFELMRTFTISIVYWRIRTIDFKTFCHLIDKLLNSLSKDDLWTYNNRPPVLLGRNLNLHISAPSHFHKTGSLSKWTRN